jgi:CelD/BcsL family acetyltransferase involved in cellulose biosynthesis
LIALRTEWLELEQASGADLPFQTWEWTIAWWTHLHADRLSLRDQLRVCVVRGSNSQVVAIAPFILTERPATGPVRVRYLQLIGADPNLTEIRTILTRPGYEADAWSALREHLDRHARDWDWIVWDGLASAIEQAPETDRLPRPYQARSSFVLELPRTWDELRSGFKRNIKESLRKCYNSLKRDGLSCRLDIAETPAQIRSALTDFFRLHAARSGLVDAPFHADLFDSERSRMFMTEVCAQLAERGAARLFRLLIGDQVVAARIGFELAGTLYLYYSGWEPAFGQYSVMTTLVAEVMQDAIRRGLGTVHLSTGKDVSKTRWGPTERRYLSAVQISPRMSARARHCAYAAAVRFGRSSVVRYLTPTPMLRRA